MIRKSFIFIGIIAFVLSALNGCKSPTPSESQAKNEITVAEAPPVVKRPIRVVQGPEPTRSAIKEPSPRHSPRMVFDSKRNKMVLYGGSGRFGSLKDTFEWDADNCFRVEVSGPLGRVRHAMAFDSVRGETVLFGAREGNATWLWNGRSWLNALVDGPDPMRSPTMVYDSKRERVVLFSGIKYRGFPMGESGETWEWDGYGWEIVSSAGPALRSGHAMVYDENREKTVLFGGLSAMGEGRQNDTWEWDGKEWIQKESSGPEPRFLHGMAYDFNTQKVLLHGGSGKIVDGKHIKLGDTWEWDGQSWNKIGSSSRLKISNVGMAFDKNRDKVIIFGGIDNAMNWYGFWEWNGRNWQRFTFKGPAI